jgi:hypothetical protein
VTFSPHEYPYSLDRTTERVFLDELANILDVLLWRANEIEACVVEVQQFGSVRDVAIDQPRWSSVVSGHTRLIGAIEAFLAGYARASLILYPVRKADQPRGRHLRMVLGIRDLAAGVGLDDRKLRDGWMHLDEDIGRLGAERNGKIRGGSVVHEGKAWYHLAQEGSVRIVDLERLAIALPRRGIWSLRPYFHRCKELRQLVGVEIVNPYRWECANEVCGIAVGWAGQPEIWMIKTLGHEAPIMVEAPSYKEVVRAFHTAVAEWRAAHPQP